MKKKYLLVLGGIITIITVLAFALTQARSVRSGRAISTPTPSGWPNYPQFDPDNPNREIIPPMPTTVQPKITDLAPNIPYEDKPSVIVQHADGNRERYLLAPEILDAFIKNLPKGDKFIGVIPPPSLLMTHEAP